MSGNLFIISAPSGAGKTSLIKQIIEKNDNIVCSISYTTREKRIGEKNGKDYYFVSDLIFESMRIHGKSYGTSLNWLDNKLKSRKQVILEIDWQGYNQLKNIFPNSTSIFIYPPTIEELKKRLKKRNTDNEIEIDKRLRSAKLELNYSKFFDYSIINEDFDESVVNLEQIIITQKHKIHTKSDHLNKLLDSF